jgi:peptide/nickel transport system substrate-binding protein
MQMPTTKGNIMKRHENRLGPSRRAVLGGMGAAVVGTLASSAFPIGALAQAVDADTLRVAVNGGSADSLDPHRTQGQISDIVRFTNLFDGLCEYTPDGTVSNSLAETFTPNADSTEWTMKLVAGVKTHAGTPFTSADVLYSVGRLLDKANPTKGGPLISFIDLERSEAVDDLTVLFRLKRPYGVFREIWANRYLRMVAKDFDPAKPVGTGPYKYVSFTPARESVFERFDGYFREPANIAKVVISNISDAAASINALRGGQVDMTYKVPISESRIIDADPTMKLVNNPSLLSIPMYMRTDIAPFNDNRVREAMRLIVDRQQMVNIALSGFGSVGNDMQGRTISPCGETNVPQRVQDLEKAKALLAEAGQSSLTVDLATTNGTEGMVECAQVLAEQAKAAGVTINAKVMDEATYLANYGNWSFGVDFLSDQYLPVVARSLVPGGSFNNTHWDDQEFVELFQQATATSDEGKRCDIIQKMRMIEYERGGNIIWGFANLLHVHAANVQGLEPYTADSSFYHLRKVTKS